MTRKLPTPPKFMKTIILTTMLVWSTLTYSQNGGQQNENNVLKIEYVAYSSGNHIFRLTNKVDCNQVVKLSKNGNFELHSMNALQESLIIITAPQLPEISLKAKRESGAVCKQNPDNGWIELGSSIILPVKFGKISVKRLSPNLLKLTFEAEEDNTIKHYNIMVSEDGKTFRKASVLFPNGITGHKKYSILIKL